MKCSPDTTIQTETERNIYRGITTRLYTTGAVNSVMQLTGPMAASFQLSCKDPKVFTSSILKLVAVSSSLRRTKLKPSMVSKLSSLLYPQRLSMFPILATDVSVQTFMS